MGVGVASKGLWPIICCPEAGTRGSGNLFSQSLQRRPLNSAQVWSLIHSGEIWTVWSLPDLRALLPCAILYCWGQAFLLLLFLFLLCFLPPSFSPVKLRVGSIHLSLPFIFSRSSPFGLQCLAALHYDLKPQKPIRGSFPSKVNRPLEVPSCWVSYVPF